MRIHLVRRSGDLGQGTVTVIGMLVLALALVGLAVDTTRLIIVRRDLQNACDAGALAGASQIDEAAFRASRGTDLRLDPVTARTRALSVIGLQAPTGHTAAVVASPLDVAVVASATVDFTFLQLVGVDSTEISAACRAEPHLPS